MEHQNNSYFDLQKKPQPVYTKTDRTFGLTALLIGFLAIKMLGRVYDSIGLMTAIVYLLLTLFNYFFSVKKGLQSSRETKAIYIINIVMSLMFAVTDNSYVKLIEFLIVPISNMYCVYRGYNSNKNSIITNVFKSVAISPFYHFGALFESVFRRYGETKEEKSQNLLKRQLIPIILGLFLSLPICVLVMGLLMSSDMNFGRGFKEWLESIGLWMANNLFENIFMFFFSIPLSMYIFAAVYSRAYKMIYHDILKNNNLKINARILPKEMCISFLVPLCFIYVAFVLTQITYLFANINTLSEVFDYSQYARSGFFELCAVAVINLTAVSFIVFFVKNENKGLPKLVRAFIIFFSVLTLFLIITALVKMKLYIDFYGATPLRVYTSVFMIYLFIMFIILSIKQIKFEISFTKTAYLLACTILIIMSLLPVDCCIARYNMDLYEKGEISWITYASMEELDSSAVSVFSEYGPYTEYEDVIKYPIKKYFEEKSDLCQMDIYSFNLSRYFASKRVLEYKQSFSLN